MAGKWRLTVDEGFCASHQLRNYNGKCEHLHGHNFGVTVEVEGTRLDPAVEILVDFGELKTVEAVIRQIVPALNGSLNGAAPGLIASVFETLGFIVLDKLESHIR